MHANNGGCHSVAGQGDAAIGRLPSTGGLQGEEKIQLTVSKIAQRIRFPAKKR